MSTDVNRTDPPSRAQVLPLMVSGTFTRTVNGVEAESGYAVFGAAQHDLGSGACGLGESA